ncbi:MAG: 4Fe-4S binding protein [Deltaproteobacteria bacterium]|nr:4Fe-4S binding protein [Deltaproteobacteria bacterium]MCL5791828.1 4Fe-4S binding protein [Deltaproteobacteria bacterium]
MLKRDKSNVRVYVQLFFIFLSLWIGIDFVLFVNQLQNGVIPTIHRPAGVEGFLPISALISLKFFLFTGVINHIHPAGFFILIAVLLISIFLKKGFCSWICPIGMLSEWLHKFGYKIFKRNFILPKWVDIPLRSLKYLLMAFFLISISTMSVSEIHNFIHSNYNKSADIKMFLFFANISELSAMVIGMLLLLSIFFENFWCRYLCPYGAMLGLMGSISPFKIRRNPDTCIDCGKCNAACPSLLPVDKLSTVYSPECTSCYSCVEICPVKDTLKFSLTSKSKGLTQRQYALIMLLIYFGIVGTAMLAGLWQNSISGHEYLRLFVGTNSTTH